MKINILTYGSRGDVQLFVALACGLQKRGHEVMLAALHDWLFPRCRMVVHHGGAGTTGAGLRAGVPNIVVPHTADQLFWGRRVHQIGAGPGPIPVKRLSAEKLTRAIVEAEGSALRGHAQAIGQRIRGEAGVAQAVERIEAYAADFKSNVDSASRRRADPR